MRKTIGRPGSGAIAEQQGELGGPDKDDVHSLTWVEQLLQEREELKASHVRTMAATIQRHQNESGQLRETIKLLESVIESVAHAVVRIDDWGTINFFNAVAETLFGYSRDEVLTRDVALLLVPADGSVFLADLKTELDRGPEMPITRRAFGQRKAGAAFPLEIRVWATTGQVHRSLLLVAAERRAT